MKRAVTTVSGARPRGRARRGFAVIAVLGFVGLAGFVVAGKRTVDQPASPNASASRAVPDRPGAAKAGVRFAQELAVTGVQHPSVYRQRLAEIAAPGAEPSIRARFGTGAAEVRAAIGGRSGVLRAVPMGYRVEGFSRRWASVSVWMVALAGGARLTPTAQWRLLTLELAWTSNGWRVSDGSAGPGPSPGSPLPLLATEAATFKELDYVP